MASHAVFGLRNADSPLLASYTGWVHAGPPRTPISFSMGVPAVGLETASGATASIWVRWCMQTIVVSNSRISTNRSRSKSSGLHRPTASLSELSSTTRISDQSRTLPGHRHHHGAYHHPFCALLLSSCRPSGSESGVLGERCPSPM